MRTKAWIALKWFFKDPQKLGLEHKDFLDVLVHLFNVAIVPKMFLFQRFQIGGQEELQVFDVFLLRLNQLRENLFDFFDTWNTWKIWGLIWIVTTVHLMMQGVNVEVDFVFNHIRIRLFGALRRRGSCRITIRRMKFFSCGGANFSIRNFTLRFLLHEKFTKSSLLLPGAGTMRLEIASSLKELSVGGGGQTRLSIISTFRSLPAITGGGSVRKKLVLDFGFKSWLQIYLPGLDDLSIMHRVNSSCKTDSINIISKSLTIAPLMTIISSPFIKPVIERKCNRN